MDALARFRNEFKRWVNAYNRAKDLITDADEILKRLEKKLPETTLRQIGGAYINGWLRNENGQNRGYFVKETDRKEPRGGQWMLENAGKGNVNPCWELYVQLSDYARLRTIAERQGLVTRLEDNLMDITVYAGERLLLYVENKTEAKTAHHLLRHMEEYGKKGFSLDDPDRINDPLKKAKYLIRHDAFPQYFGLSAISFERVFRIEYLNKDNRFVLHETDYSLTEPLIDQVGDGKAKPRSIIDPLALEIEHLAGDNIWISVGSGKTAYNFYIPSEGGDAVILGIYEDGRIWTDLMGIGNEVANRLSSALNNIGVELDHTKQWQFWRRGNELLNHHNEDPVEIAKCVVTAYLL